MPTDPRPAWNARLRATWLRARAAGSVPVATPEPDDSRITNQRGHEFTFTVELRGEGFDWSSTMVPQTVRAYDLPAAIAEVAKVPLAAWFPDESDEVATPQAEPGIDWEAEAKVWADEAVPSQPVTCEHLKTGQHYFFPGSGALTVCPGPVSNEA